MKKTKLLALAAVVLVVLAACAGAAEGKNKVYDVGDKIGTAFFDYTVEAVSAGESFQGLSAGAGQQLIVVELTIKNTQSYTMPMGRYDFRLQWDSAKAAHCYPVTWYCPEQLSDEYDIPEGEKVRGALVFQVPAEKEDLALGYLEIFEDGSQGDAYFTYFTV